MDVIGKAAPKRTVPPPNLSQWFDLGKGSLFSLTSLFTSTLVFMDLTSHSPAWREQDFLTEDAQPQTGLTEQVLSSGRVGEAGPHTPALAEPSVSWDTDMSVIDLMKRDEGSDGSHQVAWAQSALTFAPSDCAPSKAEEFPRLKRKNFLCSALPVPKNLLYFKATGARRVCIPSHTEHHSCGSMWRSDQWWRPLQASVTRLRYQGLALGLCVRVLGGRMLLPNTCLARA